MSEHSREKIALIVFVALIVFAVCCLGGYIIAGHSWNVAASNIDDRFGSMDGYTVIVYEGTTVPKALTAKEATPGSSADAPGAVGAADAADGVDSAGSAGFADSADATAGESGLDEQPESGASPSSDAATGAMANGSNASSGSASGVAAGSLDTSEPTVTAADVRASYEDKNATVFMLDTTALERYAEGTILKKDNHRFGVFSVGKRTSRLLLERQVAYFEQHGVDFVVALASDKAFVDGVSGIDIVISTQDEGLFVMGETADGTFFVGAPEVGKVGAILISPSNVVSAKVVEEL